VAAQDQTITKDKDKTVPFALEKLDQGRHGHLRRRAVEDYRFAAEFSTVPVAAVEMVEAARTLPVVFIGADNPLPHVVLGLEPQSNAMVGRDGAWRAGYVPAALRHYPLALVPGDNGAPAVGIDAAATVLGDEGHALFGTDGSHSDYVRQTVDFMTKLVAEYEVTRKALGQVVAAGLLVQRQAQIRVAGSEQPRGINYWAVDVERLHALPDATLAAWVRDHTMALIHSHLGSQGNFARLASQG